MRIGFDAKRLFTNFTGLGNYSRFVVNAVHKLYPDEKIFLFSPQVKQHSETNSFRTDSGYTIVEPSRWLKLLKLGSAWRSVFSGRRANGIGLDIYHGLSHELPTGISRQCNTVLTVHDLIFLRYPQLYKPLDRWIYTRKIVQACRRADAIVAISEQTRQDLVDFLNVPVEKISVIYQGCHPIFKQVATTAEKTAVRIRYNLPEKFLLTVGTIEPRKNAMLLVRALKELSPDHHLVVVGRSTAYAEEVKQFVGQNGLTQRVTFVHRASFNDLPAIYQAASVFIYPSFFEGFGIPLVEAITSGVPVVTSTGSCFREAAGPHALYVDPNDVGALTAAIEKVTGDSALRKRMIEKQLEHIRQFEPEVIASNLMALYRSLVE